jgi:hypothetical protein
MPTRELLPGVTTAACPPNVVCDASLAIRKARRRTLMREGIQIVLLLAVDYLFVYWPDSRLPFADRALSLAVLRALNAIVIADLWLSRALPRWTARRISSTWCRSEQERFLRQSSSK